MNKDFRQLKKYNEKPNDIKPNKLNIILGYRLIVSNDNEYFLYIRDSHLFDANGYTYYNNPSESYQKKIDTKILNIFKKKLDMKDNLFILNKNQYFYLKYVFTYKFSVMFHNIDKYMMGNKYNLNTTINVLKHITTYINKIDVYIDIEKSKDNTILYNEYIMKSMSDELKQKYDYIYNANNFDLI